MKILYLVRVEENTSVRVNDTKNGSKGFNSKKIGELSFKEILEQKDERNGYNEKEEEERKTTTKKQPTHSLIRTVNIWCETSLML